MATMQHGDLLWQDFTHSQRPVGLRPSEIYAVANDAGVQDLLGRMQAVSMKGADENYGFDGPLGVLNSPRDAGLREKVKGMLVALDQDEIDAVVHCGIGGSELGATCLISAAGDGRAEYHPITTLNNQHLSDVIASLEGKRTVAVKVSRSNGTKETLTAYAVMVKNVPGISGQVAILGYEHEDGALAQGQEFLGIEGAMSGRYTAFHAANLFTMAALGVDIDAFHAGGVHMLERCVSGRSIEDNPALELAAHAYALNTQHGKTVWNTGVFSPRLVKYGDWLGQLTEESLVHRPDINITTKTSELSNKAHSYFQGWREGANATFHQFVFPVNQGALLQNPDPKYAGETMRDVEFAAYLGIAQSLADDGRPSYTTFLRDTSAGAMGQLLMRDMVATVLLGQMYGLDMEFDGGMASPFGYFGQPGVESYKIIMKAQLAHLDKLHQRLGALEGMFH